MIRLPGTITCTYIEGFESVAKEDAYGKKKGEKYFVLKYMRARAMQATIISFPINFAIDNGLTALKNGQQFYLSSYISFSEEE